MSIIYKFKGLQIILLTQNIEQPKGTKKINAEALLITIGTGQFTLLTFS